LRYADSDIVKRPLKVLFDSVEILQTGETTEPQDAMRKKDLHA
jgi:hypothetical protein